MIHERAVTHRLVVFILGVFLSVPPALGAQGPEGEQDTRAVASRGMAPRLSQPSIGTISMDVVDANLEDVLKLLSQQAKMNFIAAQAVRDKRVTVYLDRVPVQTAIRSLLEANNLALHAMDPGDVYVVTESGGRAFKVMTKIYTLKYARVLPTVGESVKTFGNTGTLIKSSLEESSSSSSGGGGGLTGGAENQGLVAIIKQVLTEHGTITIDPRTNSIAVTDIPDTFPVVEEILGKLDVKPQQIYLEAEVLEVKLATLRRLGIEYGASTGELATFTGPSRQTDFPLGPTLLKRAGTSTQTLGTLNLANLSATLKALSTESDVKILASPRLLTLSNEVAEIRIVTDAATGLTSSSQSQTGTVSTEVERSTVGTVLRITPLVTENRFITMVIEPEVSRVVDSTKFSQFLDPHRRAARTTVMLENGGTAMIAGLLSHDRELSSRKLPILGDLPLLGAPFRRSSNETVETEIVIFITAHLVAEPGKSIPPPTIPRREQAPGSSKEQDTYRRYRQELLRQRRMKETMDLLAQP